MNYKLFYPRETKSQQLSIAGLLVAKKNPIKDFNL
jgi:hypothetical protein